MVQVILIMIHFFHFERYLSAKEPRGFTEGIISYGVRPIQLSNVLGKIAIGKKILLKIQVECKMKRIFSFKFKIRINIKAD